MSITKYDAFINKIIQRFLNITYIDPSLTIDDLWGEAYEIYAKLLNTSLSCEFITALGRQIEQRFMDMYRIAKRLDSHLDRDQFIEDFASRKVVFSRIQFSELPPHLKQLVQKIYSNPEEIGRAIPGPGINKTELIKYLTKELGWQRKTAINFTAQIHHTSRKTASRNALTAQI